MTPPHQIGHIYMLWFIFIHTHTQIHCICVQWGTYGQDPRVKCPSGDLILVWCPIYRRASHQHSTSKLALVQATGLICITASPTPFMQTNIGCVQSSQSSALTYSHITTQHKMNTCFLWKVRRRGVGFLIIIGRTKKSQEPMARIEQELTRFAWKLELQRSKVQEKNLAQTPVSLTDKKLGEHSLQNRTHEKISRSFKVAILLSVPSSEKLPKNNK